MGNPTETRTFYFTASQANLKNVEAEFHKLILTEPDGEPPVNYVAKYIIGKRGELLNKVEPRGSEKYHGFVTFIRNVPVEGRDYFRQTIAHYCERIFPYSDGDPTFTCKNPSAIEDPEFIYGYKCE